MTVVIVTAQPGLVLRQYERGDAGAIFALIDRNREHLSQYDDPTAGKYPDEWHVRDSIVDPLEPNRLRLGIWDGDTLVGSMNLTPNPSHSKTEAAVGYYLGSEFTGRGYVGTALKALVAYAFTEAGFEKLIATTHPNNRRSQLVLLRAGFMLSKWLANSDAYFELRRPSP